MRIMIIIIIIQKQTHKQTNKQTIKQSTHRNRVPEPDSPDFHPLAWPAVSKTMRSSHTAASPTPIASPAASAHPCGRMSAAHGEVRRKCPWAHRNVAPKKGGRGFLFILLKGGGFSGFKVEKPALEIDLKATGAQDLRRRNMCLALFCAPVQVSSTSPNFRIQTQMQRPHFGMGLGLKHVSGRAFDLRLGLVFFP